MFQRGQVTVVLEWKCHTVAFNLELLEGQQPPCQCFHTTSLYRDSENSADSGTSIIRHHWETISKLSDYSGEISM